MLTAPSGPAVPCSGGLPPSSEGPPPAVQAVHAAGQPPLPPPSSPPPVEVQGQQPRAVQAKGNAQARATSRRASSRLPHFGWKEPAEPPGGLLGGAHTAAGRSAARRSASHRSTTPRSDRIAVVRVAEATTAVEGEDMFVALPPMSTAEREAFMASRRPLVFDTGGWFMAWKLVLEDLPCTVTHSALARFLRRALGGPLCNDIADCCLVSGRAASGDSYAVVSCRSNITAVQCLRALMGWGVLVEGQVQPIIPDFWPPRPRGPPALH